MFELTKEEWEQWIKRKITLESNLLKKARLTRATQQYIRGYMTQETYLFIRDTTNALLYPD